MKHMYKVRAVLVEVDVATGDDISEECSGLVGAFKNRGDAIMYALELEENGNFDDYPDMDYPGNGGPTMTPTRQERLAPNGIPRWIRVYDNGPDGSIDHYTVVFTGRYADRPRIGHAYLAMSSCPNLPGLGFYQHGECEIVEGNKPGQWPPAIGRRGNCGLRIAFTDLPLDCQKAAWTDYASIWNIKDPHQ